MQRGNLFVISGPSGVGKGTLVARIMDELPRTWLSISATTRSPREGEQEGVSYYFMDKDEFLSLAKTHNMLEWAEYNGNYYGTPRRSVLEHIEAGEQVFLEIEVQGALQIRRQLPGARLIFIEPPSLDELRNRLIKRGTETDDTIEHRLSIAEEELSHKEDYDICILNDDKELATGRLLAFIKSVIEE